MLTPLGVCQSRSEVPAVRAMFTLYAVFIVAGLAYFSLVGLLQR
jgi:hypothetical protein